MLSPIPVDVLFWYTVQAERESNTFILLSSSGINTKSLGQKCTRTGWVLQLDVKVRLLHNIDGFIEKCKVVIP